MTEMLMIVTRNFFLKLFKILAGLNRKVVSIKRMNTMKWSWNHENKTTILKFRLSIEVGSTISIKIRRKRIIMLKNQKNKQNYQIFNSKNHQKKRRFNQIYFLRKRTALMVMLIWRSSPKKKKNKVNHQNFLWTNSELINKVNLNRRKATKRRRKSKNPQ